MPQKSPFRCGFADYSVFDPAGRFFLRKGYPDDLRKNAPEAKGLFLNPVVALLQVAEAFVVGSQYATALGDGLGTQLCFRIRWSGLRGRTLTNWGNEEYDYWWAKECRDDEVQLDLTLPIVVLRAITPLRGHDVEPRLRRRCA